MAKKKPRSPRISVEITRETWETAIKSASGACLIADPIKQAHPEFSRVDVDMATIRITDPAAGVRYIYLTPQAAQLTLLYFDQGWSQPAERTINLRNAVQVSPIRRQRTGANSPEGVANRRAARLAELDAKEAAGETLSRDEKGARTRMRNAAAPPERPATYGASEVVIEDGQPIQVGGKRPPNPADPRRPKHPNLLAGRNRHFGAQLAKAGEAFDAAVEAEIRRRAVEGG